MNGCHASILLENDERQLGPNLGLQQAALNLIKSICTKVHAACGPTVSCADITVLATRDAVNLAGAPTFTVNLGRKDSLAPASQNDVFTLPPPSFTADQLLRAFSDKGRLDNFDLVALSNAHTVGKARCSAFGNPSAPTRDDLRQCLTGICTSATPNSLHDLDFLTAEVFDNMHFIALRLNKGVMLNSDQVLATHTSTKWLVKGFVEPTTTNLRSKRAQ
jgi:peroxidase